MSRPLLRLLLLVAALGMAGTASAQRLEVPTGSYLNDVINGDTTATGARTDANRVYVLARDGIYLMDDDVRNSGYTLRIEGAGGSGALPVVYTVVDTNSGSAPGDIFFQEGDIYFKDFAIVGVIEDPILNPSGLSIISTTVIRVTQPGFTLDLDGVIWSNTKGQHIRMESALRAFRMRNSIWANMGYLGEGGSNFGAGKGIDLRTNSIDSLLIQNTTFVNYTDRIIRHLSSTAPINHLVFDHNTIINGVSYHGTLSLGKMGRTAQITNNFFLDSFASGADTSDVVRQAEFTESGETFANGRPKTTWILSEPNDSTAWNVANNVYSVSPAVEQFYTTFGDGGGDDGSADNGTDGDNDIIGEGSPLTDHIRSRLSNPDMAFVEMDVEVADRPDVMIDMLTWYRTETGRTKVTTSYVQADDDYDRRDIAYLTTDFDASYPTDSPAYTAAANGCPVGDLNWFSSVDVAACLVVAEEGGPEVARLALTTAPNPFQTETTVRYSLERSADVTLSIYDALGREVAALVSGAQAAGDHSATWAASGMAPGVYIVRLRADGAVATRRVLVVR